MNESQNDLAQQTTASQLQAVEFGRRRPDVTPNIYIIFATIYNLQAQIISSLLQIFTKSETRNYGAR